MRTTTTTTTAASVTIRNPRRHHALEDSKEEKTPRNQGKCTPDASEKTRGLNGDGGGTKIVRWIGFLAGDWRVTSQKQYGRFVGDIWARRTWVGKAERPHSPSLGQLWFEGLE